MDECLYQIGLDKNGDGFICFEARPGDALNLLPGGVSLTAMGSMFEGALEAAFVIGETPYGIQYYALQFSGLGAGAHYVGRVGETVNRISVSPGQTYSAGVWVRGLDDYTGLSLSFSAYDSALNLLATTQAAPQTGWLRLQISFTVPPGEAYVAFALASADAMHIEAAGYMLVAGDDALPEGFNSGDPRDFEDIISADVLALNWQMGFSSPYDHMAAPSTGRLSVWNKDGRFSPERSSFTLDPGTLLRVRAWHNNALHLLFTAFIDHIEPQAGDSGGRQALIHLRGAESYLDSVRVLTPLQTNIKSGAVVALVLNHPAFNRFNRQLDEGASVLAYVGDTWAGGIPAGRALRQVVQAERGRFFTDRRGHLVFHDRAHAYGGSQATFANAFEALHYTYGEALVNQVRVAVRPRAVGTPGSLIWQLSSPQRIPPLTCRSITARLGDANGRPIGATGILNPVAGLDYNANTAADGTGDDITAQVVVEISTEGANSSAIRLTLCNTTGADAYLLAGAQLRGTPLIQGDAFWVEAVDTESLLRYGPHTLEINLPYFVTVEEADALAQAELSRRAAPFGMVKRLQLGSRLRLGDALRLTLFDRITLAEGHTGHEADYLIIAEAHTLDLAGKRHQVIWALAPAPQA